VVECELVDEASGGGVPVRPAAGRLRRVGGMGGVQVSVRENREESTDLSKQRSVARGRCHPAEMDSDNRPMRIPPAQSWWRGPSFDFVVAAEQETDIAAMFEAAGNEMHPVPAGTAEVIVGGGTDVALFVSRDATESVLGVMISADSVPLDNHEIVPMLHLAWCGQHLLDSGWNNVWESDMVRDHKDASVFVRVMHIVSTMVASASILPVATSIHRADLARSLVRHKMFVESAVLRERPRSGGEGVYVALDSGWAAAQDHILQLCAR